MRAVAAAIALALLSLPSPALADKRKVAVLEFRSGSEALQSVGSRVAQLLRKGTSLDVLDPTEARTQFGAKLDKVVVDCAGEPRCVAGIGRKLGADEVLLVGIAEFGDVILTLQRIAATNGEVEARIAEALAEDASADDEALDGFLRRVMPREDFLRYGVIRINANVDGAAVEIGGERRGVTPLQPVQVAAPATYKIDVTKPGYIDFSATVAVPPDAEVQVRPVLSRDGGGGWYTKWWVWAIAGTVVAGGITTAVIVTRDSPDDVPVSVEF
jgi:hypothetical protein